MRYDAVAPTELYSILWLHLVRSAGQLCSDHGSWFLVLGARLSVCRGMCSVFRALFSAVYGCSLRYVLMCVPMLVAPLYVLPTGCFTPLSPRCVVLVCVCPRSSVLESAARVRRGTPVSDRWHGRGCGRDLSPRSHLGRSLRVRVFEYGSEVS
jgi:hypothetical protein